MPASLRRACQACTLAKRRCRPQLPKCERCLKNGIACLYDLEPLNHINSHPDQSFSGSASQEGQHALSDGSSHRSYLTFYSVESARQAAIETFDVPLRGLRPPELRMAADEEIVQWAISQLAQIPNLILENHPPPFVHPQLYHGREDASIRLQRVLSLHQSISHSDLHAIGKNSPLRNLDLQRLAKSDVKHLALSDVLLLIDELALYLIIYLFNDVPSSVKAEAEQYLDLLTEWTKHLWSAIPSQLSKDLTHWQAWIIGESARRSMIASHMIRGTFLMLKNGYLVFQPFLESAPFDVREGLWEAMSEEAWQSAVTMHGGEPTVLISFREFIENSSDISRTLQSAGLFQRMLLVAYYGKMALEILNQPRKQPPRRILP